MNTAAHLDASTIKAAARGRWREIFASLHIDVPAKPTQQGPCPKCGGNTKIRVDDKDGSGSFICNDCGAGDGLKLVMLARGCSFPEALDLVAEVLGLPASNGEKKQIVATYNYLDEVGTLLYQTVRYSPKTFRQRRPDGKGGWIWNLDGTRLVIYHLQDVLKADHILVVEGEKDVETANNLGLQDGWAATCNPMGAGKWRDEYSDILKGKHVVILPDADEAGRKHADQVAASLQGKAAEVLRLTLPDGVKDLSEWVEGKPPADLHAILTTAKPWTPTNSSGTTQKPLGVAYRRMLDISARAIRWLWPGRIARGKVSMLAGHPGLGKSQVTINIAATVSRSGAFPDGGVLCDAGNVIILSAEDDPADTIRPRLEAAGADLSRVFVLEAVLDSTIADSAHAPRHFNLKTDLGNLAEMLAQIGGASLIIIDPITAYLGDTDSHKNAEIRALLAPLSDLAAQFDAAVVCVSHFTKAPSGEALWRVMGSLAFVAAARAAYVVAQDPEDHARRLFLPLKNNLHGDHTGLAFRIEGAAVAGPDGLIETSRIVWQDEVVTTTANEVMAPPMDEEGRSELDKAKAFLVGLLAKGKKGVSSKQIKADAEGAGYAWSTIRRAQDKLGVISFKKSMKEGWFWQLPPEDAQGSPKVLLQNIGASSNNDEHLQGGDEHLQPGKTGTTPIEDAQTTPKMLTKKEGTSSGTDEHLQADKAGMGELADGTQQEAFCDEA